ncbi:putative 3-hydroxymethyl-3-methylglutaryl-CoA lyase 2 [Melipona quadrifasciata]|uniref:hydroxymethylglutaryl-CoA lyase n=1 Tax=Melipona quadrifasciata TaxID=166423 RepID=A0A0N0BF90_9HYME|nr:putative 3-hydroxymethyl-3-methylglutaryl-CoA lyase 2 [Melipona quadrifasciata]
MFKIISKNNIHNFSVKRIRSVSNFVKVVEVGPRDGLQNERHIVPTEVKVEFINKLSDSGLKNIEVTSFVSPKWIPQMADSAQIYQKINKKPNISYPVLVPNMKGLEDAMKVNVREIAIFLAASETFSRKNTNCSIDNSMKIAKTVIEEALKHDIKVRGYISCIVGCPYEGQIQTKAVTNLAAFMLQCGCYEISLGDTIGVGSPNKVKNVLHELEHVSNDMNKFAIHCHDTYGQALVNIYASLECGIRTFDSSVAGLGGCPYAAGASGNVATEDLLYLLHGENLETGVDLNKIVKIGEFISSQLQKQNQSKAAAAILAKKS